MVGRVFIGLLALAAGLGCNQLTGAEDLRLVDCVDACAGGDVSFETGAGTDAADGGARCKTDDDCASNPGGKVCDAAAGACVPCTVARDTCAPAQHCDPAKSACVDGCRSDEGCVGDAGLGRCDVAAHRCVECLTSDQCGLGKLCVGKVCASGCDATKGCPTGQTCCAGACVVTTENVDHCGACGNKCSIAGASARCVEGRCAVGTCEGGTGDCDGKFENACETDLTTAANCGTCGTVCPLVRNGAPACAKGACTAACSPGFGDCDKSLVTGCETSLTADPRNCGGCDVACTAPGTGCSGGACVVTTCPGALADCNKDATDGCEVDVATSLTNCGACGKACSVANGTATCAAAACKVAACDAGWADCAGGAVDGCETDTTTSASHCGGCGKACTVANGTGACTASACGIKACSAGFGDCVNGYVDGCETNLASDAKNCGACGNVCSAGLVCLAGACAADPTRTYTATFASGVASTATSSQCTSWNAFRASLSATATYSSITVSGSRSPAGTTCTGALANTLCQGLRTGSTVAPVTCGGNSWSVVTCGTTIEVAIGGSCTCTATSAIRPCVGSASWGGIAGTTCTAPSQTMSVVCK